MNTYPIIGVIGSCYLDSPFKTQDGCVDVIFVIGDLNSFKHRGQSHVLLGIKHGFQLWSYIGGFISGDDTKSVVKLWDAIDNG